ncbi:hypothetical protein DFH11DRAFT_1728476 [Phellopilus nigrolimitatus]|nr:hypothetical protein DFH11DRAFT_1728476 [Phellopilus nigrolimitatus]
MTTTSPPTSRCLHDTSAVRQDPHAQHLTTPPSNARDSTTTTTRMRGHALVLDSTRAAANAVHDTCIVRAAHPPARRGALLNPKANRGKRMLDAPRAHCEVTSGGVSVGWWIGWYVAHARDARVRRGARRGSGFSAQDEHAPSCGPPLGCGDN